MIGSAVSASPRCSVQGSCQISSERGANSYHCKRNFRVEGKDSRGKHLKLCPCIFFRTQKFIFSRQSWVLRETVDYHRPAYPVALETSLRQACLPSPPPLVRRKRCRGGDKSHRCSQRTALLDVAILAVGRGNAGEKGEQTWVLPSLKRPTSLPVCVDLPAAAERAFVASNSTAVIVTGNSATLKQCRGEKKTKLLLQSGQ